MILNENISRENMKKLRSLYERSFPKSEKKPFSLMKRLVKTGKMKIFAAEENGEFSGLAIMVLYSDIALLDYLAIDEAKRGLGIGGKVIEALKEMYRDSRLVLEIEDTESNTPDIETRKRRKKFYLSHGLNVMPYKICLFGVDMEVLTFGGNLTFEEYHSVYTGVFSNRISKNIVLI